MRLLDLFCGAGGAGAGYARYGFEVTGVDWVEQKHYPFDFIQSDAVAWLAENIQRVSEEFDLIHASPPCQAHSRLRVVWGRDYYDYIPEVRELLVQTGLPYIIENVPGAPLIEPIRLCGTQFGKKYFRHRDFEIGQNDKPVPVLVPPHTPHNRLGLKAPKSGDAPDLESGEVFSVYGHFAGVGLARVEFECEWMTRDELAQAIPPVYTHYIATQLQPVLERIGYEKQGADSAT